MSNARPMTIQKRIDNYVKIRGAVKVTARQGRRIRHKQNHAMAPFGKERA